jgi:hypothetical protein
MDLSSAPRIVTVCAHQTIATRDEAASICMGLRDCWGAITGGPALGLFPQAAVQRYAEGVAGFHGISMDRATGMEIGI